MSDEKEEPSGKSLLDIGSDIQDPIESDENDSVDSLIEEDSTQTMSLHKIRKAVRRWGEDGISVQEIEAATDLNRKTIERHLETLCHLREVYRQKRTGNLTLYYPNGKPLHSFGKKRVESGETIIDIQLAEGKNDNNLVHVTEKRYSLLEGETIEGAVIFPVDAVDDVCKKLKEFAEEAKQR